MKKPEMKANSILIWCFLLHPFLVIFFSCNGKGPRDNHEQNPKKVEAVYLTGQVNEKLSSDTVLLYYWEYYVREDKGKKVVKAVVKEGSFNMKISGVEHPGYFSIFLPGHSENGSGITLLDEYLISPGDSVNLLVREDTVIFSGVGAIKYQARYAGDKKANAVQLPGNLRMSKPENLEERMNWTDSLSALRTKVLNGYSDQLGADEFSMLEADIIGNGEYDKYYSYLSTASGAEQGSVTELNLLELYRNKLKSRAVKSVQEAIAHYSKGYTDYIILKERLESRAGNVRVASEPFQLKKVYEMIKKKYDGEMRDNLVTKYLVTQYSKSSDQLEMDSCFSDALSFVSDRYLKNMLKKIYDNQGKGAVAYGFSLPDTTGNMVDLSDFKGKLVLLDFWFTGCRACTYYAKTLTTVHQTFKGNTALAFVTISIDKDRERWRRSVAAGMYTAPGSINLYTDGQGDEHPIIEHYDIYGYPHPLLIDKEGKIYRSSGLHVGPDELIRILNEALDERLNQGHTEI